MKKIMAVMVAFLILFSQCSYVYAQEEITLSTYYPAPYGEYRTLAVGSDTAVYVAPDPTTTVDLIVEGDVGIGTPSPEARLHNFIDNDGNNSLVELLRLQRHADDMSSSANAEGGFIGLYVSDDNSATSQMARISWRADNADNTENDGRLGLWTTRNNVIRERLSINNRGRVGIGTTNPQGILEVRHDGVAHDLVVNETNGNVGIGTDNPTDQLFVNRTATVGGTLGTAGATGLATLTLGRDRDVANNRSSSLGRIAMFLPFGPGGAWAQPLQAIVETTGGGGATDNGLRIFAGSGRYLNLEANHLPLFPPSSIQGGVKINVSGQEVASFNCNLMPTFTVDYWNEINRGGLHVLDGELSIGTSSPTADLHIQVSDTPVDPTEGAVYIRNNRPRNDAADAVLGLRTQSDGGDPYISFDIQNVGGYSMGIDNTDNEFHIVRGWDFSTNYSDFTIDNNGRVGIGSTSPGTRLRVAGLTSSNQARRIRSSIAGNFYYYTSAFTEYHAYEAEDINSLAVGDAVVLVNGKVVKSFAPRQPNCIGIVAYKGIGRGNTNSIDATEETETTVQVASIGDNREFEDETLKGGDILKGFMICDEGGPVREGDLLTTSSKPGFLMKQDGDILHSYTVGKSLFNVEFDKNGEAKRVYGYLLCN